MGYKKLSVALVWSNRYQRKRERREAVTKIADRDLETNNHNPIYSQAWLRSMKGLDKGGEEQAAQGAETS